MSNLIINCDTKLASISTSCLNLIKSTRSLQNERRLNIKEPNVNICWRVLKEVIGTETHTYIPYIYVAIDAVYTYNIHWINV